MIVDYNGKNKSHISNNGRKILSALDDKKSFVGTESEKAVIGLNLTVVKNMFDKTKEYNKLIVESFHEQTNTILETLGVGWGTADSYKEVEEIIKKFENCAYGINKLFADVASTIKINASKQLALTKNADDLITQYKYKIDDCYKYKNYQKSTLENGYIGVVPSILKEDIPMHTDLLISGIKEDMSKYRDEMYELGKTAFSDYNKTIANRINSLIENMIRDIKTTINNAVDLVKEKTKYAVQYQIDATGDFKKM